jgi:ABC-type multidrug transport system permease subunit
MRRRWAGLWQLFLARVREFYREPTVLLWAYAFPAFLAIGLGYATAGGVSLAPGLGAGEAPVVAVAGETHPDEAAALTERLHGAGLVVEAGTEDAGRRHLRSGRADLLVLLREDGYEYVFDRRRPGSLLARYCVDDVVQRWKAGDAAWPTVDRMVEEPGGRYIDFLVPGLMGLNLLAGGLWGIGFVIVDFRTRKLLKQLVATPMRRSDFLLAVVGSRLLLLVPEMLLLALVGVVGFGMPFRGDVATLALVLLAGGAAFAGLGLLIAARPGRTETMVGVLNLVMLPMWMLSGTFFSPSRFPSLLQPLIRALPLTQLNDALREVILEGAPLDAVALRVGVLAGWAVVCFLLALVWFRWR